MQDNLKLIIWTIVALIGAWFIAMTVNRNIFLHSDVDRSITGVVFMSKTDIGAQCGDEYVNVNELVEYKMNANGQIVYLCPQGYWPIQSTVTAVSLTNEFRAQINPNLRDKLNKYYPVVEKPAATLNPYAGAPAAAPVQPQQAVAPTPPQQAATTTPDQQSDQPVGDQLVQPKGLFPTQAPPAPVQPKPTPAKPADTGNPFLGNPAPAAPSSAAPAASQ